jgi:electron-transferring-flavoprotein dehydrogenase
MENSDYNKKTAARSASDGISSTHVSILIVGAGPAGLSAAITLKKAKPALDVVVIDKASAPGNHNLSGASLEADALHALLDSVDPNWPQSEAAKAALVSQVDRDDVMFFLGSKLSFRLESILKIAKSTGLGFGQMIQHGDYLCSISKLTMWLNSIAQSLGVEILHGFAAEDILWDATHHVASGVKLVDQGLDKQGNPQPNYLPGETISADLIILAEGCDGLVSEKFIQKAGLARQGDQLYSIGVKELIKVTQEQYKNFGIGRVVHALGWPLWTPVLGPAMFGGGVMQPMNDNHIAVGMIVALDFKYCDFNPQDALARFKEHKFVNQFIAGGTVVEAGAKMIPEGGLYSVPCDPATGTIGRSNVAILGDSAGFVNMLKIKGLHNAIFSGIAAANAAIGSLDTPLGFARMYTRMIEQLGVLKDMESAKNFRQTVAKLGPLFGMPISALGKFLPKFHVEPDYKEMTSQRYKLKPVAKFDKDTFTAMAATHHREEQPCHLLIQDAGICMDKCTPRFGRPCITFCPAGVYEMVHEQVKAANPSNCLHCKTCQRKCPYDNIRWTVPEPTGGPKYKNM